MIEVGKRGGCKATPQAFIEKLLVALSREGKTVARLKGGDPFVFGRGGEELQALRSQGVDVEVIPGITAGIGAPATLGIPVTHRDCARGVTFISGHTKDGAEPDWQALARCGTTLVIYMGMKRLESIGAALMRGGLAPETPACVIERGTLETQRQVVASLGDLARAAAGLQSPAIIVVGDVVRFASIAERQAQARAA